MQYMYKINFTKLLQINIHTKNHKTQNRKKKKELEGREIKKHFNESYNMPNFRH